MPTQMAPSRVSASVQMTLLGRPFSIVQVKDLAPFSWVRPAPSVPTHSVAA